MFTALIRALHVQGPQVESYDKESQPSNCPHHTDDLTLCFVRRRGYDVAEEETKRSRRCGGRFGETLVCVLVGQQCLCVHGDPERALNVKEVDVGKKLRVFRNEREGGSLHPSTFKPRMLPDRLYKSIRSRNFTVPHNTRHTSQGLITLCGRPAWRISSVSRTAPTLRPEPPCKIASRKRLGTENGITLGCATFEATDSSFVDGSEAAVIYGKLCTQQPVRSVLMASCERRSIRPNVERPVSYPHGKQSHSAVPVIA